MTQPVLLIYTDNPGSLPANHPLPDGTDVEIQSVVARIDGSGAAGSFYPALSVYSQSGLLMARVRGDTLYAAGDTGVVTWSPFLRQAAAATPPPSAAAAMYPMFYEVLPWDLWNNLDGVAAPFFGNDLLNPGSAGAELYVNGWRFGDTRNGANFLVPLRLGPQGSVWSIQFIADGGPNAGIVDFFWQTISESVPGAGYDLNGLNILGDSVTRGGPPDPLVYYRTSVGYQFDAYGVGAFTNRQVIGYSQFRIMGADGAAITANGVPSGADDAGHVRGQHVEDLHAGAAAEVAVDLEGRVVIE